MEERVYNFSAGPSQMPLEVLKKAQRDLLCYQGAGCSVLEMSHRSPSFDGILQNAKSLLRSIMNIKENYEILFLQGGASTQFSMIPMNLASQGDTMCYVHTGVFSGKAKAEGDRWGNALYAASAENESFRCIPKVSEIPATARYLHITGNNTVYGTAYHDLESKLPANVISDIDRYSEIPLVADWSSAILGQWIDVDKYGLIYAGAQKNMGPAGLTAVIIRKDLLERVPDPLVPSMLRYKVAADHDSMYNTPPTFSIYIASLMFEWVKEQGGVKELEKRNQEKAALLYDFFEESRIFTNTVKPEDRSIMNVTFTLPDDQMSTEFLSLAKRKGLINLKGHRAVGGCRASIYNGMPEEGVIALLNVMKEFELEH